VAEVCPKCRSPMMANVCSRCGLPSDICACVVIDQATHKIRVFIEIRKFRKPITIVEGISDNAKGIAKQLKSKLACGGTYKDNHIELQGDHKNKMKDILVRLGYSAEQIEVS